MPPWSAEPGHEPLRGMQPLTAREIDILCDWAAGGALNTDAVDWGGSGVANAVPLIAEPLPWHAYGQSLSVTLPPLAVIALRLRPAPAGP